MALQQRTVLGKVTINHKSGGHCEVQEVIEIYDDVTNEIISEKFHRSVIDPDDDVKASEMGVKHITDTAWTPVIREKEKEKVRKAEAKKKNLKNNSKNKRVG